MAYSYDCDHCGGPVETKIYNAEGKTNTWALNHYVGESRTCYEVTLCQNCVVIFFPLLAGVIAKIQKAETDRRLKFSHVAQRDLPVR